MQVKFYNELNECTKYRLGDGFGKTTIQDFKERIFTRKYLLESFIILAAKSRIGNSIDFVSDDIIRDKNSKYFFENLDFLFDIDFTQLKVLVDSINFEDFPKGGDFYFMIEIWGKYSLFYVSA